MATEENKGTYFLKLEIDNFRCFKDNVTLDLSNEIGGWRKWTVILGDNGVGKTSLLQCLANFETIEDADSLGFIINLKGIIFSSTFLDEKSQIKATVIDSVVGEVEVKYGREKTFWPYDKEDDDFLIGLRCYGYGANRFMSKGSLGGRKSWTSETLFKNRASLINAEEWLLKLDYAASKESDVKDYATKRRNQVEDILREVLPDISNIRFTSPTRDNLSQTVEFQSPYGWVTIHQLSLGYKTMVAWMIDLAAHLFDTYPDSENPLAEPAIVLVDEIDLHLHPKWQQKIFGYLDEKFPATQFIVTAHSPLVVQSAPADANIVLLKREGDHVVIKQDIESVREWRLDQILASDIYDMGIRNPDIEKQLKERTVLLQKDSLTPQEKERLAILNKMAHGLPTADNAGDIEAMDIIRSAAEIVKNKK